MVLYFLPFAKSIPLSAEDLRKIRKAEVREMLQRMLEDFWLTEKGNEYVIGPLSSLRIGRSLSSSSSLVYFEMA
jgi:hypothetical protein